jgi:hypothetical protein
VPESCFSAGVREERLPVSGVVRARPAEQ